MNDYVIGSGAVLTAGPDASIVHAALHAQTEPAIAATVRAALFDFESPCVADLSKVVLLAAGWTARRVRTDLVEPLLVRGECTLADVLITLAGATGSNEVHIFAHWLPSDVMVAAARRAGVCLVAHPLDAVRQAALICGQTYCRWASPMRAA